MAKIFELLVPSGIVQVKPFETAIKPAEFPITWYTSNELISDPSDAVQRTVTFPLESGALSEMLGPGASVPAH